MNLKIIPKNSTILIGFSGGPDSVYLLLQLKKIQESYNLQLIAMHLDHEWRKESGQDTVWCQSFCKKHNISFVSEKASQLTHSHKYKGSKEEYARKLRQQFFQQTSQAYPNSYIALGHHQDDQIENFFIRLARGTSLAGLTGMKTQEGIYLRPLLNTTKKEIIDFFEQKNVSFLQDSTNTDLSFLRNRVRHLLTPKLPEVDPRLPKNIISVMNHIGQVDNFLAELTITTMKEISSINQPNLIKIKEFLSLNQILQQRILLQLLIINKAQFIPSQSLFAEIIRFLRSNKSNEHAMHSSYKVIKIQNHFSIIKR